MKEKLASRRTYVWISLVVLVMLAVAACQPAADVTPPPDVAEDLEETPRQPIEDATEAATVTAVVFTTEEPPDTTEATATAIVEMTVTPAAVVPPTGGATLNVATHPELGEYLVDAEGMTLYMFTRDEPGVSNCAGDCLNAWPPLVAEGEVTAGAGVDPNLIGSADLPDGRQIVTYNEMPLYYWQGDEEPGDVNGQGVNDVWFVVSPQGERIESAQDTTGAAEEGVVVNVASDPELGEYLVDGEGMTLYMFTRDEPGVSNCIDGCLEAWPPLVAEGEVIAGEGVDETLFSTAEMRDGNQIVTYNGMPLYYWQGDAEPGDTTGQGVNDVWFVVSPEGEPIGN